MPKRKRTKPKKSKKVKRGRKRRSVRRARFAQAFPKSMPIKLTYCDTFTLPNTSAGSAAYRLCLNSIHAPSTTGGGSAHQPRGHDQWAAIYSKYCVVGAKVKVEPIYSSTSTAGDTEVTIKGFMDDDVAESNYTVDQLIELGMLGTRNQIVTIGEGPNSFARQVKPMIFKFSARKFFGISKKDSFINAVPVGQGETTALLGKENVGAKFGANPTMPCYLKLSCAGLNHDSQNATVAARVTIEYSVIVHSPKEVAAS